jgi:xanthine/CO dehydrogenase XdhC/CoxF family maturation factor
MRDILEALDGWRQAGERIALATVVRTSGSTPRPAGAAMGVTATGHVAGSVSGGCLEADIVEEAFEVLRSGHPKLVHYGITDDMAWEVGLSCGGELDVFVEPLTW